MWPLPRQRGLQERDEMTRRIAGLLVLGLPNGQRAQRPVTPRLQFLLFRSRDRTDFHRDCTNISHPLCNSARADGSRA